MKYATVLSALAATALAAPSRDLRARGHRRSQNIQAQGQGQGSFGGFPPGAAASSATSSVVPGVAAATGSFTKPSKAVIPAASSISVATSKAIASSTSTSTSVSTASETHASTDDEYNVSWAGAVLNDGSTYTGVYGEFTVPTPKKPTVGETSAHTWYVSSWVGIDGYTQTSNCKGLWQAGVDASIDSTGALSYVAWYEWYPANTIGMDLEVKAGDHITVNLTRLSSTSGSVSMHNLSSGKTSTKTATSASPICGAAAEWIVEDLSIDSASLGLANFGNVTFHNAVAYAAHGTVSPKRARIMDVEDKAKQILTASTVGEKEVVVKYV